METRLNVVNSNDGHIDESDKIRLPCWLVWLGIFIGIKDNPIFLYNYSKWALESKLSKTRLKIASIFYFFYAFFIIFGVNANIFGFIMLITSLVLGIIFLAIVVTFRKTSARGSVLIEMEKEIRVGTLGLLFVTPLTDREIFFGKSSKGIIWGLADMARVIPAAILIGIPWLIKHYGLFQGYSLNTEEILGIIITCFLVVSVVLMILYEIIIGSMSACIAALKFPAIVAPVMARMYMFWGVTFNVILIIIGMAFINGFGMKFWYIGILIYLFLYFGLLQFGISSTMDNGSNLIANCRRPGLFGEDRFDASEISQWGTENDGN